jgi:hypothetical protein
MLSRHHLCTLRSGCTVAGEATPVSIVATAVPGDATWRRSFFLNPGRGCCDNVKRWDLLRYPPHKMRSCSDGVWWHARRVETCSRAKEGQAESGRRAKAKVSKWRSRTEKGGAAFQNVTGSWRSDRLSGNVRGAKRDFTLSGARRKKDVRTVASEVRLATSSRPGMWYGTRAAILQISPRTN